MAAKYFSIRRGPCSHSADSRCLREDPLWHFTAARPFTFKYPGQLEASDLHGGVPAVWPTLEEQVDQAFTGSVCLLDVGTMLGGYWNTLLPFRAA